MEKFLLPLVRPAGWRDSEILNTKRFIEKCGESTQENYKKLRGDCDKRKRYYEKLMNDCKKQKENFEKAKKDYEKLKAEYLSRFDELMRKEIRAAAPAVDVMCGWLNDYDGQAVSIAVENALKEMFCFRSDDDLSIAILGFRPPGF